MYTGTDTAVPVPVTTRGIGIHSSMIHHHYATAGYNDCTATQLYRVSLIQLDVKMQINCRENLIMDSEVDITTPLAYFSCFNDISAEPNNFSLLTQAINGLGNFRLDDADYHIYIPEMDEVDIGDGSDRASVTSSQFFDCDDNMPTESTNHNLDGDSAKRIVPNPYLITIHNLRQVVLALADPNTPLKERQHFIHRNPLPSAKFHNYLLTNPDEIMPANFNIELASVDILAFRKMLFQMQDLYSDIIESISYRDHGDISILSCVHHPAKEHFSWQNGSLLYSDQSSVRSMGPKDGLLKHNGSILLMSEYPDEIRPANWSKWAIRSPYLSNSVYQTNWMMAVYNYYPKTTSGVLDLKNIYPKKGFEL